MTGKKRTEKGEGKKKLRRRDEQEKHVKRTTQHQGKKVVLPAKIKQEIERNPRHREGMKHLFAALFLSMIISCIMD